MVALALAAKMKGCVISLNAKELAIVMSRAAFQPRFIEHVPGSMNLSADSLSPLWDPTGLNRIPSALPAHLRVHTPDQGPLHDSTLQPKSCYGGWIRRAVGLC